MRRKKLKWGQTPWDDMPRDELLREMQRAYAAVTSAHSVMSIIQGPEPDLFWTRGSGRGALAMCAAVRERVESRFDDESVYRSFFRYAVDLLFEPREGFGWAVCPDGHMVGNYDGPPRATCTCGKTSRPLEWKDLERPATPDGGPDRG